MLVTFKNKYMLALRKAVDKGIEAGGVVDRVFVSETEMFNLIREVQDTGNSGFNNEGVRKSEREQFNVVEGDNPPEHNVSFFLRGCLNSGRPKEAANDLIDLIKQGTAVLTFRGIPLVIRDEKETGDPPGDE